MALKGSKVVFVGNIPYDTTEETMIEIFQEVGPVVNFRINKDRETGKAKGYGFCEYHDAATAASAVRNLDGYGFGGRQLKVAPADSETPPQTQQRFVQPENTFSTAPKPNFPNGGLAAIPPVNSFRPPVQPSQLPQVKQNTTLTAPSVPPTEAINATLATMSPDQIFELLTQINIMVQYSPDTARSFLSQNPQLCYALFQALFILNLISPEIADKLLAHSSAPEKEIKVDIRASNPDIRPPLSMSKQVPQTTFPHPPSGVTLPMASSGPYDFQPKFTPQNGNGHPPNPFVPQHQFNSRPPSSFLGHHGHHMPPMPPMPHNPTPGLPPQQPGGDQNALLLQVMQMTPDQIDQYPPEHRDSLLRLRASLLNNNPMAAGNRY